MVNYYDILEIKQEASQQEVKSAFRYLVKKYHPDLNKADNARQRFELIYTAYEILSEPEKREIYNELLAQRSVANHQASATATAYDFEESRTASRRRYQNSNYQTQAKPEGYQVLSTGAFLKYNFNQMTAFGFLMLFMGLGMGMFYFGFSLLFLNDYFNGAYVSGYFSMGAGGVVKYHTFKGMRFLLRSWKGQILHQFGKKT